MSLEAKLMEAIEDQDLQLIQTLLKDGADIHALDEEGDSCLGLAVADCDAEIVKLFIDHNADTSHVGSEGFTLWHWAAYNHDHKEVWELVRALNLDINTRDKDGVTPIAHAFDDQNLKFAAYAVQHGADVNISDNDGWTPLHHAAASGDLDVAKFLVENGARKDLKNKDQGLPCQYVQEGEKDLLVLVAPDDWVKKPT